MRHWLNGKQNSLCLCSYAVFMVIRRVHPALLPLFPPSSCSLPLIHHSQLSWMLFFHRVLLSSLPFLSVRYTFALTTLYHSAIISQTSPHHRPSPPSVYPSPSHHPPIQPYRSTHTLRRVWCLYRSSSVTITQASIKYTFVGGPPTVACYSFFQ